MILQNLLNAQIQSFAFHTCSSHNVMATLLKYVQTHVNTDNFEFHEKVSERSRSCFYLECIS